MPELTKKRPTKGSVELRFIGPMKQASAVRDFAVKSGFREVSDAVPWREAFPWLTPETESGTALRGARRKEGLTQVDLAALTGIPQRHISEMENGKRSIGKERARALGKVLKVSYRVFL